MTTDTARASTAEILAQWAGTESTVLSVAMPLHPAGPEAKQNEIRRKNALRDAADLLDAHDDSAVADVLREQLSFIEGADLENVNPAVEGVLWLIAAERRDVIWSPTEIEESVRLSRHASLRPLLPMLHGVGAFHLLALSENRVTLFRGTRAGLSEVPLKDVASSLEEERWMDDFEKTLQWHSASRGGRTQIRHGHGAPKDQEEIRRERFFQAVARAVGVWRGRNEPDLPFGVAAVGSTAAAFDGAHADGPDVDFVIEGSPDDRSDEELFEEARAALQARSTSRYTEAEAAFEAAKAGSLHADEPTEIVRHACTGRVATLLVAGDDPIPAVRDGDHEDGTPRWRRTEAFDATTVDLVDVIIAAVLMHGGEVVAPRAGRDAPPDSPPLRATLRF